MFERFTDRARHTVVIAQDEARALNHAYIGTEHLLLGLLRVPEGIAARALRKLGIGPDAVRRDIEGIIGRGQASPPGHIPFTPRSKKVLELSLREALGALEFKKFQPTQMLESGNTVVALLDIEATVKATGKPLNETDEMHLWRFNDDGSVASFRHGADTYAHHVALRG